MSSLSLDESFDLLDFRGREGSLSSPVDSASEDDSLLSLDSDSLLSLDSASFLHFPCEPSSHAVGYAIRHGSSTDVQRQDCRQGTFQGRRVQA